jgi:hypothetical protein
VSGDATTMRALTDTQSRPVSYPDVAPADRQGHQFAVSGAALCFAVAVATIAMTASAARLRRSRDSVAGD